mmetsp:Transcript_31968/g.83646  ORF Transcript_31968/g.83646 Transcript_31968/m.83646 type:complete len:211 (+) Transcript_31968:206-838(+)
MAARSMSPCVIRHTRRYWQRSWSVSHSVSATTDAGEPAPERLHRAALDTAVLLSPLSPLPGAVGAPGVAHTSGGGSEGGGVSVSDGSTIPAQQARRKPPLTSGLAQPLKMQKLQSKVSWWRLCTCGCSIRPTSCRRATSGGRLWTLRCMRWWARKCGFCTACERPRTAVHTRSSHGLRPPRANWAHVSSSSGVAITAVSASWSSCSGNGA